MDQLKNLLLQIETPLIKSFSKTLGAYEELYVTEVHAVLKDFYTNLDIISTNVKDPSIVFCLYIALINSRIKKYIGINTTQVYYNFVAKNKKILEENFLLDNTQMYYVIPFLLQHLPSLAFEDINFKPETTHINVYINAMVKTFYLCIGNRELLLNYGKIFNGKKLHNSLRSIDETPLVIEQQGLNIYFTCGDKQKSIDIINDSYFTNKKCKILSYDSIVTDVKTDIIKLEELKEYEVVLIPNATRSANRSIIYNELKNQAILQKSFVTFNTLIFASNLFLDDKYYGNDEATYFSIPIVGYDCDSIIVD